MTPDRYRQITDHYNFRTDGSARFFGINDRTSRRYASGSWPIPRITAMLLELMYKTDADPEWLLRKSGDLTPQQIRQLVKGLYRD